jgi:cytochrome c
MERDADERAARACTGGGQRRCARGCRTAVSLAGFGRHSYIAGRLPNEPRLLERWLIDPAALVPGTAMPAMGVSAADARDMAAYLRSLR